MAIDSKKDDSIRRIIQTGEYLKVQSTTQEGKAFGEYLVNIKKNQNEIIIQPLSLFADTLDVMRSNPQSFKPSNFEKAYKVAVNVYNLMFYHGEETPNFESLRIVYLELFEDNGILSRNLFSKAFYDCFSDKQNLIRFYQSTSGIIEPGDKWKATLDFASESRKLYFDDDSFMAALRSFVASTGSLSVEGVKAFAKDEIDKLYRMNGIYNVTAADIAEVDLKLSQINDLVARAQLLKEELDSSTESLKKTANEAANALSESINLQSEKLRLTIKEENENVKKIYDECLQNINNSVNKEIQKSTANFLTESREEIDKLALEAKQICANAAVDVSELNSNADSVISRMKTAVVEDATVAKIIANSEKNKVFLEKINAISAIAPAAVAVPSVSAPSAMPVSVSAKGGEVSPVAKISTVNVVAEKEKPADLTPSELLDSKIPFKERFKKATDIKNRLAVEKGEFFHEKFDDVLIAVMENTNPYLIGPSGCGKTYLIKQISDVLNLSRTDIGYINEEYDILGFQTANGSYSKPNFYRCYKYGGIAFCDELDNGNSRASVKLNSFLSNTEDAYFCFPNGELVPRHPNFRFVSAGNTDGNGANMNYNSREKIEESVMQRLLPIYIGYDNRLEKSILKDYPEWFDFVCLFRNATTEWQNTNGVEASGIITTRDTSRIKKYLTNNSFDTTAIIKYEFIQTKNLSYLTFLADYMKKNSKGKDSTLLNIFINLTEQYKKDGGWNR